MNFTIANRIIDTENDENLISYNTDYIANFSFDEEWEGTVKTARFIQNGAHEDKVLVNDSCEIPRLKNGVVRIGVFNDTMTSTYKLLKVWNSIKDDSGNPVEPEPDVYAQLINLIQSGMLKGKDGYTPVKGTDYFTEEEVEAIIGEADVFSQKAEQSATAAEQSARTSSESALASEQSAKNAAASEKAASDSANAAGTSENNAVTSAAEAKKSETAAATSAKSAADSASAAEKSKNDAQTLVDNFGRTVEEATAGAVNTVNETKDNAVNEVNALLDTIPEDYTAMSTDVDKLKSDLITKANQSDLDRTNDYLDALFKLNRGQTWDAQEAESNAYAVDVPSGVKYASVDMVGGKSIVFAQYCNFIKGRSTKKWGVTFTVKDSCTLILNGTCTVTDWTYAIFENLMNYRVLGGKNIIPITQNGNGIDNAFTTGAGGGIRTYFTEGITYDNHEMTVMLFDKSLGTKSEIKSLINGMSVPYCEPTIISSQTDRVDVRGKNLFNENAEIREINVVNSAGEKLKYKAIYVGKGLGEVYVSSLKNPNKRNVYYYIMCLRSDGTFRNDIKYFITPDGGTNGLITVGKDEELYVYDAIQSSSLEYISEMNIQIEKGSTATDYSPYSLQQIETGFPELNSAGEAYNYVDLSKAYESNGKYYAPMHQRVFTYDMGALPWKKYSDAAGYFAVAVGDLPYPPKCPSSANVKANVICPVYTTDASLNVYSVGIDKTIGIHTNGSLLVQDKSYTDAESLKTALSGQILHYELAEEIITDIEIPAELVDWLTVEAGGSITFHHADDGKRLLIPNKETFIRKLDEVV